VYLPEIFDSAQEGYSYLWVNGEKYIFSEDVLNAGKELKDSFYNLKTELEIFNHQFRNKIHTNDHFRETKRELNLFLERFDSIWATYEKNYILELMVIEADSRRYIEQAIKFEKALSYWERQLSPQKRLKSKEKRNKIKKANWDLIQSIWKINSIANTTGKGRDDLSYSILEAAESRMSSLQVQATKNSHIYSSSDNESSDNNAAFNLLCNSMQESLTNLRVLISKYAENIEVVDPQLKNNPELIEALTDFENSWTKGKLYLVDNKAFEWFISLSRYINYAGGIANFGELIEWCDYEVFMIVPELVILNSIFEIIHNNLEDGKFNTKELPKVGQMSEFINIIVNFCPNMIKVSENGLEFDKNYSILLRDFSLIFDELSAETVYQTEESEENFTLQEMQKKFEESWIEGSLADAAKNCSSELVKSLNLVKSLGVELQRTKPSEWNDLLNICIKHT
jgi:hypothetical protein